MDTTTDKDHVTMQTATVYPPAAAGSVSTEPASPANAPPLRVLVADDDPASRRFLVDAIYALGALAQSAIDGLAAISKGRAAAYDLLLLDCRMPGAGALEVLATLRSTPDALSADSVAVASSAQFDPSQRRQLLEAGFRDVLLKPCTLGDLRRVLALARPAAHALPLLDDDEAIKVGGDSATMLALRGLLRDELALMYGELAYLSADPGAFTDRLHRLRSSCGFCGAAALSSQVTALQQELMVGGERTQASVLRFGKVLMSTLEALEPPAR